MAAGISGYLVDLFGRARALFSWPVLIVGVSSDGKTAVPVVVGSSGGITVVVTPTIVTPHFFAVTTTTPVVIPIGAIDASVLILTGTGTLNTIDQPVGVPWTEPNKLAATVTLVLASASSARVYYGT